MHNYRTVLQWTGRHAMDEIDNSLKVFVPDYKAHKNNL